MRLSITAACTLLFCHVVAQHPRFVEINKRNPAYFELSDGTTYVPVGINMINPSGRFFNKPDSAFAEIESWMQNLSANGGNYIRVWLSNGFWDIEEEQAGKYSEDKIARIDRFISMARKYHLRIKLTLEHFRSITLEENPQQWATKFAYHKSHGGPLDSVRQYLTSDVGHRLFLDKVNFYKQRYGADTLFFGWELWNEMNAVKGPEDSVFFAWNEMMLGEVKKRFPQNLVMQSLGSFDNENVKPVYERMMRIPGNEVAQVHRYLDLGAKMEVCHAPMDVICSSAVRDLQDYRLSKPVMLAETGAVEPNHAGPSKYYPKDTAGILLHDILFAPFFAGSAGTGMSWHWESYVDKNNLWYHFGRFNKAIKGFDPVAEEAQPSFSETDMFRIYILRGKRTTLIWLRDKGSNWQTELEEGKRARSLKDAKLDLKALKINSGRVTTYDPWQDAWNNAGTGAVIRLPEFRRSIVVRIENKDRL